MLAFDSTISYAKSISSLHQNLPPECSSIFASLARRINSVFVSGVINVGCGNQTALTKFPSAQMEHCISKVDTSGLFNHENKCHSSRNMDTTESDCYLCSFSNENSLACLFTICGNIRLAFLLITASVLSFFKCKYCYCMESSRLSVQESAKYLFMEFPRSSIQEFTFSKNSSYSSSVFGSPYSNV